MYQEISKDINSTKRYTNIIISLELRVARIVRVLRLAQVTEYQK